MVHNIDKNRYVFRSACKAPSANIKLSNSYLDITHAQNLAHWFFGESSYNTSRAKDANLANSVMNPHILPNICVNHPTVTTKKAARNSNLVHAATVLSMISPQIHC